MKLGMANKLWLILIVAMGYSACISSKKRMEKKLKTLTELTYAFGDASVPPPFHRSYTLVANKDTIQLTVDSYGEVLAEKTYGMPEGGLQRIAQSLLKHNISERKEKKENDGCTGGTTRSIAFTCAKDTTPFYASAYYCGGAVYGTLTGDVDSFFVDLKTFVPDLSAVIRSTE